VLSQSLFSVDESLGSHSNINPRDDCDDKKERLKHSGPQAENGHRVHFYENINRLIKKEGTSKTKA